MEGKGFLEILWMYVEATSFLEWLAVITGVVYVILASYQSIWCWLFAFVSSSIYVYLCIDIEYYIESGLQLFYVAMAIVGWLSWKNANERRIKVSDDPLDSQQEESAVQVWSLKIHALNIVGSGVVALTLGWTFDVYTNQSNPYMDAFTTVYSLLATFMVTRRVLENWIYWVVIDLVSIFLYSSRELYLSSLLYAFFTVLAVFGFITWYREYKSAAS